MIVIKSYYIISGMDATRILLCPWNPELNDQYRITAAFHDKLTRGWGLTLLKEANTSVYAPKTY